MFVLSISSLSLTISFVTFLTGGLRVDVDAVDSDSATAAATFDSMMSFRSPSKAVVSNALG